MTETHAVSIEDVRLLVGERQRYDDWIAALEAKRGETPARVFDRVHGDYSARRADVMERLREHIGTLAALGNDLEARLSELEARLASLEDERIEAMLRTAVGEFDSERWDTIRKQVEASIAEHTDERDLLLMEVDDVRTLLASANSEPGRPAPVAEAPAEPAPQPVNDQPTPIAAEPDATEPAAAARSFASAPTPLDLAALDDAAVAPPVFAPQVRLDVTEELTVVSLEGGAEDDRAASALLDLDVASDSARQAEAEALELEDALVLFSPDTSVAPSASAAPGAPSTPAASESHPAPSSEAFDDLAFLRSVIDPGAGSAVGGSSNGAGGSVAAAPRSVGAEPQKTLRCTECGTMNLPTEWYCERCGGELAAF